MKQIQVTVPAGDGANLIERLTEVISPSQITIVKGSDTCLILLTVASTRTGFVLDLLNESGIGRVKGRISILDITTTIPKIRPRKQDKFLRRISLEELGQDVAGLAKLNFNYISLIILSSILAAMGLITDNHITLVASMIVAPLMGPIVAMVYGAVASDQKILKEGLISEGIGAISSIFIGFIIGLIYKLSQNDPSSFIIARGEPNLVDLLIAIASGLTAGICFVSGVSLALVGVAAAASLLPVTVNVGIALGMFEWRLVFGSLILFITNVVCVHLGCMIVFWIRKVEPPQVVKKAKAKRSLRMQLIGFGIILVLVALPIVQTSVQIVRKWKYQTITNEVSSEILQPLDGVIFPPEELMVIVSGGLFSHTIDITIRIFSMKELPNSTYLALKQGIENRTNHELNSLTLEVILIQSFEQPLLQYRNHLGLMDLQLFKPRAIKRITLG